MPSPMYNVCVSSVAVEMLQTGHENCNLPNEWYPRQHAFETAVFCGTHPVEQISFFFSEAGLVFAGALVGLVS